MATTFWENIVGTFNDGWRYSLKPALMDAARNPDQAGIVAMVLAMDAVRPRHEKELPSLHPAAQPQPQEAAVAAPHSRSAAKKKISPTAVKRGGFCVQRKAEMKQILYMTREGGMSIKEIRSAMPDFGFWDLAESDALSEEDRYTALHPNQWKAGYPPALR